MRTHNLLSLALAAALVSPCYGQFAGSSFFSTPANSTMGAVTNSLSLTDNANGFVVSGQLIVTIPAGPVSGLLAHWVVDRPLAFPYGPANLTTTTVLDGFSAPPPGTVGNSQGLVESIYTDYLGTTMSLSMIPMTLVAGVDSPLWLNLTSTSAVFSHTATAGQFLRQSFFLDGNYIGGPGGNWVIDVPVTTTVNVVPEPSALALAGAALGGLVAYGWRRRRATV